MQPRKRTLETFCYKKLLKVPAVIPEFSLFKITICSFCLTDFIFFFQMSFLLADYIPFPGGRGFFWTEDQRPLVYWMLVTSLLVDQIGIRANRTASGKCD